MNEHLREIMDASEDLLVLLNTETTKLYTVMSALYEQAEDDPTDPEIPGMLRDAANHAREANGFLLAFRDYLTDIAKELL